MQVVGFIKYAASTHNQLTVWLKQNMAEVLGQTPQSPLHTQQVRTIATELYYTELFNRTKDSPDSQFLLSICQAIVCEMADEFEITLEKHNFKVSDR